MASQSDPTYAQAPRPLPDIKPSNFVALSRPNSSVSGKWIIEPALLIPPTLLPPLSRNETEETRRNLSLECHNGSVDAEIFIMPRNDEASRQVQQRNRIFIETSSKNGSVTTKVVSQNRSIRSFFLHIAYCLFSFFSTTYLPRILTRPASQCQFIHPQSTVVLHYTFLVHFKVPSLLKRETALFDCLAP